MKVSMVVFPEEMGDQWQSLILYLTMACEVWNKGYKSHAGCRVCTLFLAHHEQNGMRFRGGVWWILCSWNVELMSGRGYFFYVFFSLRPWKSGAMQVILFPYKNKPCTHWSFPWQLILVLTDCTGDWWVDWHWEGVLWCSRGMVEVTGLYCYWKPLGWRSW